MLKIIGVLLTLQPLYVSAADVLFLERDIKKGEIITQDDTSVGAINSQTSRGYMSSVTENMRAKRNLEGGKPLKKTDVYTDNSLVKKGDIVSVKFIKKNLVIEVKGTAMGNGTVGEIIKIKTVDTNKILTGKISEEGSIIISN